MIFAENLLRRTFIKTIKITPQIGKADLERKMQQAQKFLTDGEQVQIQVFLKGRQKASPERAVALLEGLAEQWLESHGRAANSPSAQRLSITFNPVKR